MFKLAILNQSLLHSVLVFVTENSEDTRVKAESQKFCNILVTWGTDAFNKILKVTKYTELWNGKLAWYSPSSTHWICLSGLEHSFEIHAFKLI